MVLIILECKVLFRSFVSLLRLFYKPIPWLKCKWLFITKMLISFHFISCALAFINGLKYFSIAFQHKSLIHFFFYLPFFFRGHWHRELWATVHCAPWDQGLERKQHYLETGCWEEEGKEMSKGVFQHSIRPQQGAEPRAISFIHRGTVVDYFSVGLWLPCLS